MGRIFPASKPLPIFFINSERVLLAKLEAGWELVGTSYRKGDLIEAERADVIAFCVEQGSIVKTGDKPPRYKMP